MNQNDLVTFIREKKYIFKKELGQGACGKTVLLYDDIINEQFVCKKYNPLNETDKQDYFKNFIAEIKLLHLVHHLNVVRVFNYYMYPEHITGYILMEYINGDTIDRYLNKHPENIDKIFIQVIEGFTHLETNHILHRDIRPQNIMVTEDVIVKIIDLGFSKKIDKLNDFDKSISLNWLYDRPKEFDEGVYNYQSEIYFIGKLFEKIINEEKIEHFKYKHILREMISTAPDKRERSFVNIKLKIAQNQFAEIDFSYDEKRRYKEFADSLVNIIAEIEADTKYFELERIQSKLEDLYKKTVLEDYITYTPSVIGCFLDGGYKYTKNGFFDVSVLESFIQLLRSCSKEKKNIIIDNLNLRLNAVTRPLNVVNAEDDIPF